MVPFRGKRWMIFAALLLSWRAPPLGGAFQIAMYFSRGTRVKARSLPANSAV
jgi:hypothetical protein